jgi:hypothetical protein
MESISEYCKTQLNGSFDTTGMNCVKILAYLEIGMLDVDILSLSLRGLGGGPSFDLPFMLPLRDELDAFDAVSQLPPRPRPSILGLSRDDS